MDAKINSNIVRKLLLQTAVRSRSPLSVLFVSAGTIRWPQAWVYMALLGSFGLLSGLSLAQHDPELVRERMRGPIQREQKPWNKVLLLVIFLVCRPVRYLRARCRALPRLRHAAVARGSRRGGRAARALYLPHCSARELVCGRRRHGGRRSAGHQVISTGPYAWVRHPIYAGAILFFLGTALLLGSWYAFAIGLVLIALLGLRAVWEEDTLKAELPGYPDHAARVRYRFVPGVW